MRSLPLVITLLTTRVVLAPPPLPASHEDTGAFGKEARCFHVALCTSTVKRGQHISARAGGVCSGPSIVGWAQITEGTGHTEAATRQTASSALSPPQRDGMRVSPTRRVSQGSDFGLTGGSITALPRGRRATAWPVGRQLVHLLPYPGLKFLSCPPPNSIGYRGVCSPSPRT